MMASLLTMVVLKPVLLFHSTKLVSILFLIMINDYILASHHFFGAYVMMFCLQEKECKCICCYGAHDSWSANQWKGKSLHDIHMHSFMHA